MASCESNDGENGWGAADEKPAETNSGSFVSKHNESASNDETNGRNRNNDHPPREDPERRRDNYRRMDDRQDGYKSRYPDRSYSKPSYYGRRDYDNGPDDRMRRDDHYQRGDDRRREDFQRRDGRDPYYGGRYDRDGPRAYDRDGPRAYDRDGPRAYDRDGPRAYDRDGPRAYDRDGPRAYDRDGSRGYDRRYKDDGYRDSRPKRIRDDSGEPNETLGVFGLGVSVTEPEFTEFLDSKLTEFKGKYTFRLIYNKFTGVPRGFAFIVFETLEDATAAKNALEGGEFKGNCYRVAYSLQRPERDAPRQRYTEGSNQAEAELAKDAAENEPEEKSEKAEEKSE